MRDNAHYLVLGPDGVTSSLASLDDIAAKYSGMKADERHDQFVQLATTLIEVQSLNDVMRGQLQAYRKCFEILAKEAARAR